MSFGSMAASLIAVILVTPPLGWRAAPPGEALPEKKPRFMRGDSRVLMVWISSVSDSVA